MLVYIDTASAVKRRALGGRSRASRVFFELEAVAKERWLSYGHLLEAVVNPDSKGVEEASWA